MKAISLFSGAGGLDVGLEHAGIHAVSHCEINAHAAAVLRHRWPDTPIHDDVTTFDGTQHAADLVHGGSPCTDLSVAGRRAGLAGEHSGLYWHQVRVWRESGAPWFLWENVVGAFSSHNGADFAAVLWGITGALPEVPDGGWRNMGFIVGPTGCAVWRLLDARWFGVAQRRRRVFVVGCAAADVGRAIEVLLDAESVQGNPPPVREAGEDVAGTLGGGSGGRGWAPDTDRMTFVPVPRLAHGHYINGETALTLRTRAGDGTSTDLAVAVSENQRGEVLLTDYAHQITTGGGKPGQGYPCVMAFDWTQTDMTVRDDLCHPLSVGSTIGLLSVPAVAYPRAMRGRDDGAELELGEPDTYNALRAASRANTVLTPQMAVRRLTPIECERLMGWPDDWTRWGDYGNGPVEIADSHRYAMCGNGVVANQAEWIGHRLIAAAAIERTA